MTRRLCGAAAVLGHASVFRASVSALGLDGALGLGLGDALALAASLGAVLGLGLGAVAERIRYHAKEHGDDGRCARGA